jgi:hypothetical protein
VFVACTLSFAEGFYENWAKQPQATNLNLLFAVMEKMVNGEQRGRPCFCSKQ